MKKYLSLTLLLAVAFSLHAQDPALKPFYHGVASGDALADRVIIWTRVSDTTGNIDVAWKMATDTLLLNVVQSGSATTDTSKDFTVKVDVTGLQPDTWYYYQFRLGGKNSLTGRTKTLPIGNIERVRFAVASCEDYDAGIYYNSWLSIASRNDIQAVVFLGDYIYESSGSGPTGGGVTVLPNHEILSLQDYRERYNSYQLDPYLRRAHQQYPFYNVWDDHEVANNSWMNGSDNHSPGTEGDYQVRKAYAQRVFFEWLPIREKSPGNYSIYRSFSFGNLADLIMLDTRHEGRDEQVSTTNTSALQDTSRTILGEQQRQWFFEQLDDSQAQWKVVGQQVMIAPLRAFGAYLNADQWDGYQGDRNRVINHVLNNSIENVVWLTGDIHSGWANDIPQESVTYNPATGAGSAFVEFVCTSITSGGVPLAGLENLVVGQNPHVKWANLSQKGYIIVDIDTGRTQSDWFLMSTVTSANYTVAEAASWYVNKEERFLRNAGSTAASVLNSAPFAPLTVNTSTTVKEIPNLPVSVYPNPFEGNIRVELQQPAVTEITVRMYNIHGKRVYDTTIPGDGTALITVDTNSFPAGDYLLTVEGDNAASRITVVKTR